MKKYLILLLVPFFYGFTYPVDLSKNYVFYDTVTFEVGNIMPWPRSDGEMIEGSMGNQIPLTVTYDTEPVYDSLTQALVLTWVIDVPAEEYRYEYSIRALTQEELDVITQIELDEIERQIAELGREDMKNHSGGTPERLDRLEQAVAYLLNELL